MKITETAPRPNGRPVWQCKTCQKQFQTRGIAEHHRCQRR